ncbi:unnamed protein product [Adineta ricciae]|nr:unnamed protein product [Adineta ricciae]
MENNTMVATINTTLVNVTLEQCTCALLLTLNQSLTVALNYFHMNQTCQLFSYNSTSIWITSNVRCTFKFINRTSILIQSFQSDSKFNTYISQSVVTTAAIQYSSLLFQGSTSTTTTTQTTSTTAAQFNLTFSLQVAYPTGISSYPAPVFVADVNQDNNLDIIVGNFGSDTIGIFLNTGTGTFRSPINYISATGYISNPNSLSVTDVNGDNTPDIIVANQGADNVGVFFNIGNGTFIFSSTYSTGSSSYPACVSVSDINNDQKPDIVVVNFGTDNIGVLLNFGNGTFRPQILYSTGSKPQSAYILDVNGDDKPDIIVGNYGDGNVGVFINYGNGTFRSQVSYSTGGNSKPYSVFVEDMNSDGKFDIIVANSGNRNVGVLFSYGNGTFRSQITYSTGSGSSPYCVFVNDMNNDGKLDIIAVNRGTNNVGIFLNTGNGTFLSQQTFAVGSQPFSLFVADINFDSKSDIVVTNLGSDNVGVLLANWY